MVRGETLRIVRDVPEGGFTMIVINCWVTSGALGLIRITNRSTQQLLVKVLMLSRGLMDYLARLKMNANYQERWGINNLIYITKTQTPMDATDVLLQFNEHNLHSELVKQDVLILTGAEDHFIPLKMHYKQVNALGNAKSVTARIFTKEDLAQNHCQIGNIGLALDVMEKWIKEKTGM